MHETYSDITIRLGEPCWYDEQAVPRYCAFDPKWLADIYAREAVLLRIECQACGRAFDVAMSYAEFDSFKYGKPIASLASRVADGTIHYGDPPNAECCAAGPTMNSEPRRVLEFWRYEHGRWTRVPELERELPEDGS